MAPVCLPCYDTETLLSYIVEDSGVDELIFNQTSVALRILLPKYGSIQLTDRKSLVPLD